MIEVKEFVDEGCGKIVAHCEHHIKIIFRRENVLEGSFSFIENEGKRFADIRVSPNCYLRARCRECEGLKDFMKSLLREWHQLTDLEEEEY